MRAVFLKELDSWLAEHILHEGNENLFLLSWAEVTIILITRYSLVYLCLSSQLEDKYSHVFVLPCELLSYPAMASCLEMQLNLLPLLELEIKQLYMPLEKLAFLGVTFLIDLPRSIEHHTHNLLQECFGGLIA